MGSLTGGGAEPAPRRQFLTLLFTDLSGSSVLAGQLEFEPFAALLEDVRGAVAVAVSRHGGKVVRTQGDGSLSVFGYPIASEHDARHACEAAIEVHAAVAAWPALRLPGGLQRLALHSGVHSGLVYVSPGDRARGELDVVGDAANTAARIASFAGRGRILADADSLGPELAFFDNDGEANLSLPGRAVPVRTVRVTGLRALRRRIDARGSVGRSPLLGRDGALAELLKACSGETGGQRVTEIRGPAGIGKTRLLDELADQLAGCGRIVLRGGCESYGITPVLEPFRQLLATQTGDVSLHAAQGTPDVQDLRTRSLRLFSECDDGRHVLLLDDWQWADDASRQLLDDVLSATSALHVVVASREAEDLDAKTARVAISPQPLTPAQTRGIVQALVPGTNPFIEDELHEYAGGVPLLVEELCQMLRHRGESGWRQLRKNGPRAGSGSWMKSLMATRLESLDPPALSTVQAAAVLGIRSPRWQIGELLPGGIQETVLRQLADADLLYAESADAVRFRHGLSRDAVYELIPLDSRVALHRQVVQRIETLAPGMLDPIERLESLAHHARAAGDWPQATQRCEAAADEAMRLGAFDSARRQYLAAIEAAEFAGIEAAPASARWCSLVHRLGMTCMFDPLALPEALPLVERCVQTARELGGEELLARSLYWEAYLCYVFGQPRRAARLAEEARSLALALGNPRLLAQVDATLGQVLAAVCRYPAALAAMDIALHTKQSQSQRSSGLAIGSAFTLACLASVHGDRGDFVAAHDALDRARALIVGQPNHPVANSVRNWEMVVLAWQRRWDDVLAVVAATTELAQRSRALLPLSIARAVGGYARWRLYRDPAAIAETAEAVRWMENHRVLFFTTLYYGWLVEMSVEAGRPDEAMRWAGRLLQRARAGERLGEAAGWRAMATVALEQGDHGRAWRRLARADASAARRQSAREAALNNLLRARLLREDSCPDAAAPVEADARARLQAMGIAGQV